jgi:SAM-dependent methyltransferase
MSPVPTVTFDDVPHSAELARFERVYAESDDPWGYCASRREREKHCATLTALPDRPLGVVLEVGCSIGVFTNLLAGRAARVVGLDFSRRALELADARVGARSNVELVRGAFPSQIPDGTWDVVICSEILYYLTPRVLLDATDWLEDQLRGGTTVLAVSRGGGTGGEPLSGGEVHDHLARRLSPWHALDGRAAGYRLDRFDGKR